MLPKKFTTKHLVLILGIGSLPYIINTLWIWEPVFTYKHNQKVGKIITDLSLAMLSAIPFWLVISVFDTMRRRNIIAERQFILFGGVVRDADTLRESTLRYIVGSNPDCDVPYAHSLGVEPLLHWWQTLCVHSVQIDRIRAQMIESAKRIHLNAQLVQTYEEEYSSSFNKLLDSVVHLSNSISENPQYPLNQMARTYSELMGDLVRLGSMYEHDHKTINPFPKDVWYGPKRQNAA